MYIYICIYTSISIYIPSLHTLKLTADDTGIVLWDGAWLLSTCTCTNHTVDPHAHMRTYSMRTYSTYMRWQRTIPSSCFEMGRGFFCFKHAEEKNEWARYIFSKNQRGACLTMCNDYSADVSLRRSTSGPYRNPRISPRRSMSGPCRNPQKSALRIFTYLLNNKTCLRLTLKNGLQAHQKQCCDALNLALQHTATHCNTLQHTWSLQAHQKQCCDALSIAARHSFWDGLSLSLSLSISISLPLSLPLPTYIWIIEWLTVDLCITTHKSSNYYIGANKGNGCFAWLDITFESSKYYICTLKLLPM